MVSCAFIVAFSKEIHSILKMPNSIIYTWIKRISLILFFLSTAIIPASANEKQGKALKNTFLLADSTPLSEKLFELRQGTILKIIGEKYNWYKVKIPENLSGFVYADYIDKNKSISKVEHLNIRLKPDLDSPVIGRISKGDHVKILFPQKGKWYEIQAFPYSYGWVSKEKIKIIPLEKRKIELIKKPSPPLKKKIKKKPILPKIPAPTAKGILYRPGIFSHYYRLKNKNGLIFLDINDINTERYLNKEVNIWGVFTNERKTYLKVNRIELQK